MNTITRIFSVIAFLCLATGCEEAIEPGPDESEITLDKSSALEIEGDFNDEWNSLHQITQDTWTSSFADFSDPDNTIVSVHHFTGWNNDLGLAVAQNDADHPFFPDLWSAFRWIEVEGQAYFCQSAFDAESAEEAAQAPADDSDPANGGCGVSNWSQLNPVEEN